MVTAIFVDNCVEFNDWLVVLDNVLKERTIAVLSNKCYSF